MVFFHLFSISVLAGVIVGTLRAFRFIWTENFLMENIACTSGSRACVPCETNERKAFVCGCGCEGSRVDMFVCVSCGGATIYFHACVKWLNFVRGEWYHFVRDVVLVLAMSAGFLGECVGVCVKFYSVANCWVCVLTHSIYSCLVCAHGACWCIWRR